MRRVRAHVPVPVAYSFAEAFPLPEVFRGSVEVVVPDRGPGPPAGSAVPARPSHQGADTLN